MATSLGASAESMGIQQLENVGIIVTDLEAATAFFLQLGLTVVQEASVEEWVDRCCG